MKQYTLSSLWIFASVTCLSIYTKSSILNISGNSYQDDKYYKCTTFIYNYFYYDLTVE